VTEKEKWYKTEHVREKFPEQCSAKWGNPDPEPRLYLPAINEFIPSQFGILSAPAEVNILSILSVLWILVFYFVCNIVFFCIYFILYLFELIFFLRIGT